MTHSVDAELAAIQHLLPTVDLSDLAGARAMEREFLDHMPAYEPMRQLTTSELRIPGLHDDSDVSVQIVVAADAQGSLPALLYLHGGGYVMGSIKSAANSARRIADEIDVAVILVDYRLAPEHPYPAALEDCYATLSWATGPNAPGRSIDRRRIMVLGDSAGGGLAIALALLSRDRGGPEIAAQFLDAPTIDDRCDTVSAKEFSHTPIWRGVDTPLIWQHYLGRISRGGGDVPLTAAPARATIDDLPGLPPTWIASYQIDPTRDEILLFAHRLIQAGVQVDLCHFGGAFHMAHTIPGTAIGEHILEGRIAAIRRLLH